MSGPNPPRSRRDFILHSAAASAALLLPGVLRSQSQTPVNETRPSSKFPRRDTQLKFNADGTPHAFAGNTVLCHLPAQCLVRDEMSLLRDALAASSFRDKLGLTSVASYHMTIFSGANDQDRTITGWPAYVPADAPIEVCNRMVGERMAKLRLHCELPIRVRIDQPRTMDYPTPTTLHMVPADADEQVKLRSIRDQIAEAYGFRSPTHATYEFHITMSYQVAPLSPQEQADFQAILKTHIPRIASAAPVLELGNPEYCTFPDMFRFEPRLLLRCS